MKVLLDTHVVLALVEEGDHPLPTAMRDALKDRDTHLSASVTSLWEIMIKRQIGRVSIKVDPATLITALSEHGCTILDLTRHHVLSMVDPLPSTRDPFDRILLSMCKAEHARLMTWDEKLRDHPLAWRPA